MSRAFAVLVALATVVGNFFALSHEIAVRHVRCPEHGELTHVVMAQGPPGAPAAEVDAWKAAGIATLADHDHCAAVLALQTGVTGPVFRSAAAQGAPPPISPARESVGPPRERAFLLASAPKTSPPFDRA